MIIYVLNFILLAQFVRGNVLDASNIVLNRFHHNGKAIVVNKDVKKGDVLISMPLKFCLISHYSGAIYGLSGQSDDSLNLFDLRESLTPEIIESKGITWDVRLAIALAEASLGNSLHNEGLFWDSYSLDLPKIEDVTVPFTFDSYLLEEMQWEEAKVNAIEQQNRMHKVCNKLYGKQFHRITNECVIKGYDDYCIPDPYIWSFAMVRSRCIHVLKDYYMMVPIIDMCNHSLEPNAELQMIDADDTNERCSSNFHNHENYNECVYLTATRDLKKGDEVTISYGDGYSNRRLFTQYGFIIEGNINDRIDWNDSSNNNISGGSDNNRIDTHDKSIIVADIQKVLVQSINWYTYANNSNNQSVINNRIKAVSFSLTSRIIQLLNGDFSVNSAKDILLHMKSSIVNILDSFPTKIDEDYNLINNLVNTSRDSTFYELRHGIKVYKMKFLVVIKQRIERKLLLHIALSVLNHALDIL